jgi:hypothetical protein
MYRKTLIALACAVISVPAFAQDYRLPHRYEPSGGPCPDHLVYGEQPCSSLQWNQPDLTIHSEPNPTFSWTPPPRSMGFAAAGLSYVALKQPFRPPRL